jgi:hypothetical protein
VRDDQRPQVPADQGATQRKELADLVAQSIGAHGIDAALWCFKNVYATLLPLAAMFQHERELTEHAVDCGLGRDQALDALSLMGWLLKCDGKNPHAAWMASEILLRHCPKPDAFSAGLHGQTTTVRAN